MEEDLNMSESENEESFHIEHPIVSYCFAVMEYLRSVNPELFNKAVEYAEDLTGVIINDFSLEERNVAETGDSVDITEEINDNGPYGPDDFYPGDDEESEGDFYDDDQYYG
jgi:hypothetical protein